MTYNLRTEHDIDLEYLANQLDLVDESRFDIHWIMSEGIWYKPNTVEYHSLCDLILVYIDSAVAIEYKTTKQGRGKALHQIQAGKEFILDELKMPYKYGKFVWKADGNYHFEIIR